MLKGLYEKYRGWKRARYARKQLKGVSFKGTLPAVFGRVDVINPKNLSFGSGCSLNHGCYINALNPIQIGDDVTVSAGGG